VWCWYLAPAEKVDLAEYLAQFQHLILIPEIVVCVDGDMAVIGEPCYELHVSFQLSRSITVIHGEYGCDGEIERVVRNEDAGAWRSTVKFFAFRCEHVGRDVRAANVSEFGKTSSHPITECFQSRACRGVSNEQGENLNGQ
jgi:hypothetical protein